MAHQREWPARIAHGVRLKSQANTRANATSARRSQLRPEATGVAAQRARAGTRADRRRVARALRRSDGRRGALRQRSEILCDVPSRPPPLEAPGSSDRLRAGRWKEARIGSRPTIIVVCAACSFEVAGLASRSSRFRCCTWAPLEARGEPRHAPSAIAATPGDPARGLRNDVILEWRTARIGAVDRIAAPVRLATLSAFGPRSLTPARRRDDARRARHVAGRRCEPCERRRRRGRAVAVVAARADDLHRDHRDRDRVRRCSRRCWCRSSGAGVPNAP